MTSIFMDTTLTSLRIEAPPNMTPDLHRQPMRDNRGPVRGVSAARFELLSDAKPRWDTFGMSFIAQCLLVGLLLLIPLIYTEKFNPVMRYYIPIIATPKTEVLLPPPPPKFKTPPQPKIKIEQPAPEPVKPLVAKLVAPKFEAPIQPKPRPVDMSAPEVKPTDFDAKMELKSKEPPRPREPIKVGVMASTGSAAPATVNLPAAKVQTGGFGDPNGLPGPGDPNKRSIIARQGSPALPPGDGYGNGTGGKNGVRGTVASAGFGNGTATPLPSGSGPRHGAVKPGGFSDATATVSEGPKKKAESTDATTSVSIIEKPKPAYTEEARKLKIEGDVVVDVVFLASGQVQVNRVISGLGHGLDESALRAAAQIKFKPARHENTPVDFPARVRIEFRMAY